MKLFALIPILVFTSFARTKPTSHVEPAAELEERQSWSSSMNCCPLSFSCLSQSKATEIVNSFITILEHTDVHAANWTAQALLADDFTETSDSILSLEGVPLGGNSFNGKQAYIDGVLSNPGITDIQTNDILVAGCSNVLWYWTFKGIGTKVNEIKGLSLFAVTDDDQISQIKLEFNSIAWALDTGYQVIFPASQ